MSRRRSFPWEHYIDEEAKTVYVHIPGGYPTTLALPIVIRQFFPDYEGKLCSQDYLANLINQNK